MPEVMAALALLSVALLPLAYGFIQEKKLVRAEYYRTVAMEIVDGEMEILAAGEWKRFPSGTRPYPVRAESAKNLPPGRFVLTVDSRHVRLEWLPRKKNTGGSVTREVKLR
jgi:hypothetical protein